MADRSLRILHVNAQAVCGGAEMMILRFLERSAERGDVTAAAMAPGDWAPRFAEAADRWYELPLVARSPARLPGLVLQLRRVIRDFRPEVIHAHNPTMMLGATLASRGLGVGLVGTVHGNETGDYRAEAAICRLFPGPITAVTPYISGELFRHRVREVATIANGVAAGPGPLPRAELVARFGIQPDRPLVVGVGRLATMKRWHLAIDAMAEVPEATLLIFGEGPLRADLEARIRRLGLDDRVRLPGVVPDVRACTAGADCALVTTSGEGCSLALLELLAAGVPLVAADVPGISDTVGPASALMVDAADTAQLAGAIRAILDGDPGVAGRVAAGRDIAEEHSEERMIDRYFDCYRRALR